MSCEPLLEDLGDLSPWLATGGIHQVIGGGESGRRHRPVNLDHARSLRDQCLEHGVPFWKQNGGVTHDAGGDLLDGRRWKQLPVPRSGALVNAAGEESTAGPFPFRAIPIEVSQEAE